MNKSKTVSTNDDEDAKLSADNQPNEDIFSELKLDISKDNGDDLNDSQTVGFLRIRKGNTRITDAQKLPIPKDLFHGIIFQAAITILFADTGVGKSILAVQIALEIAKVGETVVVIDLELSDKQFEGRYSNNYQNPFIFPDNFHISDMANYPEIPDGWNYEDYFIECLRQLIIKTKATFIVIDNMTKLVSADTDKAQAAKPLMDRLIELKREFNLTMLLLEHTKKVDGYSPISLNHLQGSKFKANFADSVFSIGRSAKDSNYRYIKQLKCRSSEIVYDENNVMVCELIKENSFLHLKPIGYGSESEHLKHQDDKDKASLIEKAKCLSTKGKSQREIANELGISLGSVNKYLKK